MVSDHRLTTIDHRIDHIMETENYHVLIGGTNDGKRLCVPHSMSHIMMHSAMVAEGIKEEQYYRQRICGNSQTFEVFTIKGMSGDDMISSLIRCYPQFHGHA